MNLALVLLIAGIVAAAFFDRTLGIVLVVVALVLLVTGLG